MNNLATIYQFIESEENRFNTEEIKIFDNWSWNMRNHIQMSLSLKHGIFMTGENNWLRPFKKVIEPILTLRYRAEDIELRNNNLYTENENYRVVSFLINKYHDEVYSKEHDLDTFFDKAGIENIDLGGVYVQKGKDMPEVMPLQRIAFCDQTDIKGGPIGFKYYFSPSKLRKMASVGWGDEKNGANISINELILLAENEKDVAGTAGQKNRTTGKNIEVYIVRGDLPEAYLKDNDNMDDYYNQIYIVAFYKNKKEQRIGVTLYRKKEDEDVTKFFASQPIDGRAVGTGGAEALFNEQIWTNFLEIHKMKLLEAASKVPLWTDDSGFANRQQVIDMENLELMNLEKGSRIGQVPTAAPANIALFERSINDWFQNAQLVGSAQDPQLGRQSFAGQTFRGQERLLQEGKSTHEYRKGKFAKFIEEIYRDWIIPDIKKEILKGKKFLSTLNSEEMEWVTNELANNFANRTMAESVLNGEFPQKKEVLIQDFKDRFSKKGNKLPLEILKDEFEDIDIKISINVSGKQKNLTELSDKILSIFQFIFSNPQGFQQVMQIPGMSKAFNDILEFSGLSPVDFASFKSVVQQIPQQTAQLQATPEQSLNLTPEAV